MDTHAHTHEGHAHQKVVPPEGTEALKDPVCGMTVTEQSPHRLTHAGRLYCFCSARCQTKFAAEPAKFATQPAAAKAALAAPPAAAPGTDYTCPMHPEVRQDHAGNCPKCGMALEPVLPTLDDKENPELADFKRRFW